jgi:hypothetical protein
MMIANVDHEVEAGTFIAFPLGMWHLGDTPVKIQFRGHANGFTGSQIHFSTGKGCTSDSVLT